MYPEIEKMVERAESVALYYFERPSVEEQQVTPTMREISRRECLEIAVFMREMAALLLRLGEREGWRPIESAPRDDTTILVYGDGRTFTTKGLILLHARKPSAPQHLSMAYLTHWKPLPSPPVAALVEVGKERDDALGISEGRRRALEAKAREVTVEWRRAENAEARADTASRQLAEARAEIGVLAAKLEGSAIGVGHAKEPPNRTRVIEILRAYAAEARALLSGDPR